MSRIQTSIDSLTEATRERGEFSGHGNAKGIAGYVPPDDGATTGAFLHAPGDLAIIDPKEHGFREIAIGMSWDNVNADRNKVGFLESLTGGQDKNNGVDLDLGCLYELNSGARGAIQAFGERFGKFGAAPFIALSGDERTGDAPGEDEYLVINGQKWPEIKRVLLYAYIYAGTPDWSNVHPQIQVRVPGDPPLTIVPKVHDGRLAVCAVASLENVRDGIKLTNHTEYFAGHEEMDAAFGFGLAWQDGEKR